MGHIGRNAALQGMTTKLLALLSLLTVLSTGEARADVVSDRVFLITGAPGCPTGSIGFRRIKQTPDGAQTQESNEFQVPLGSYLEVTSIEYTTPYHTQWAMDYSQSLDILIRARNGSTSTSVLSARYQNGSVYAKDGNAYVGVGEIASQGARTRVAAFPAGPLMGSAARLCAAATHNFWLFGGSVRVRGRLIPTGGLVVPPPTEFEKVH